MLSVPKHLQHGLYILLNKLVHRFVFFLTTQAIHFTLSTYYNSYALLL
jgi:hypothetical protein